jgi:hypothetical protein
LAGAVAAIRNAAEKMCEDDNWRALMTPSSTPASVHPTRVDWRVFIGGSDAPIIMGEEGAALVRLWREKRGEVEPPDYSDNLIVQLGVATEPLNRRWYEKTTGQAIKDVQSWVRHPVIRWMAATAGRPRRGDPRRVRGEIHAALVVLGGGEKHMPQHSTLRVRSLSSPWSSQTRTLPNLRPRRLFRDRRMGSGRQLQYGRVLART